jgi:hypothetical protein
MRGEKEKKRDGDGNLIEPVKTYDPESPPFERENSR